MGAAAAAVPSVRMHNAYCYCLLLLNTPATDIPAVGACSCALFQCEIRTCKQLHPAPLILPCTHLLSSLRTGTVKVQVPVWMTVFSLARCLHMHR